MEDLLKKKNLVGRLLITADDFCASPSIDAAVIDLVRKGIVTNVAVMANLSNVSPTLKLIEADCSISCHYNVSSGTPISEPGSVKSLVDSEGRFYEPSSLKLPSDYSLKDCIGRYYNTIIPLFKRNELILELKNQYQIIKKNVNKKIQFCSFHHDLDKHQLIKSIFTKKVNDLLESRQILLQKKKISGFEYYLLDHSETYENYKSKIINSIIRAIKRSALSGGIPFEIALHPANQTSDLSKFTIYKNERLVEYKVWDSESISKIFSRGKRTDCFWTFPFELTQEFDL